MKKEHLEILGGLKRGETKILVRKNRAIWKIMGSVFMAVVVIGMTVLLNGWLNQHARATKEEIASSTEELTKQHIDLETLLTEQRELFSDVLAQGSETEQSLEEVITNWNVEQNDRIKLIEETKEKQIEQSKVITGSVKEQLLSYYEKIEELNRNLEKQIEQTEENQTLSIDSVNKRIDALSDMTRNGLDQVFRSVSDGKKSIASALLTKGVECPEDASFTMICDKIDEIEQWIPAEIVYSYHVHVNAMGEPVEKEQNMEYGGCFTKAIVHVHEGDSVNGGNCYQKESVKNIYCGTWKCIENVGDHQIFQCTGCGSKAEQYQEISGPGWGMGHHVIREQCYVLSCEKDSDVIEGYQPECGMLCGQITGGTIRYVEKDSIKRIE